MKHILDVWRRDGVPKDVPLDGDREITSPRALPAR